MKKSSYHLKSPDLLPIAHSERKISTLGFSIMWVGMAVVLAAFAIGGDGVQGMPLIYVLLASIIGCILIGLFITLTADVGIEHGLSFPVYMRAPFGVAGTHFPSIVRGITASIWFGINTYFGSAAINGILNILTGFDNWFVCFLIFALAQLINTAIGIKAVEKFADLAAPIIILIALWMYSTLVDQAAAIDRNVWTWIESPVSGILLFTAFMTVITGNMGYWSTLATDASSLSRFIKAPKYERNWFKRNKGVLVGSVIALPLTQTLIVAIGGVAYIAVGNYDPIVALQESASGWILVVLLLMIVFSQWSTNTSANVVPAATIFSNAGGPKVPFYVGVFLAGIVGTVTQPWNLFNVLIPFLTTVGGILSAIVGVIFADYYILRKRRLNVHDLYEKEGQYAYVNGVNWAGILAWVIGGAIAIVFPTYSFFVGFIIGAVSYYLLAKYWWFQKYKQAEIEDPDDDKYLGITVGRDWLIDSEEVHESKKQVVN
ncbi:NCS1 family transporter [Alkalihalobacillus oceani]|uniref:NCS1 family transporter n=1 Tax=Halalkalibacter oceani TaxID=1653776 RepID=UPI0020412594|nr:NCS1 family transporter [Halalkalibacter oceani]MCM3760106.1 NCS1 family transporter [Halalkalibacter oceani]